MAETQTFSLTTDIKLKCRVVGLTLGFFAISWRTLRSFLELRSIAGTTVNCSILSSSFQVEHELILQIIKGSAFIEIHADETIFIMVLNPRNWVVLSCIHSLNAFGFHKVAVLDSTANTGPIFYFSFTPPSNPCVAHITSSISLIKTMTHLSSRTARLPPPS